MKKLSLLFVSLFLFVCFSNVAFSQLLTENFDYANGALLTANGWTVYSGTTAFIAVGTSNGLSYTGYTPSGGNAAIITNTGEDDYRTFATQTIGTTNIPIYVSFLVSMTTARTGGYFMVLMPSTSTTNFALRCMVKAVGTTGWNLGLAKSTETPTYGTSTLALNATYLVVLKLELIPGALNDKLTGWVFTSPTLPANEGAAGTPEIPAYVPATTNADAADINRIGLRQGSTATDANLVIDGLRVGLTWSDAPLPVELSSFTSNVNGRNIQLNWSTKTEKNSDKFVIERNTVGSSWVAVGSVKASVLSNSTKNYSYSDNNLNAGKYQYRLKMVDNDGTFNYSNVTEVEVALPANFELSQNFPNPFNPSTKINYNLPSDSKVTLEVFNMLGVKVGQLVDQNQSAGFYSVNFNSSLNKNISSGVYLYKLTAVDNVTGVNFSSIKKMMMLK